VENVSSSNAFTTPTHNNRMSTSIEINHGKSSPSSNDEDSNPSGINKEQSSTLIFKNIESTIEKTETTLGNMETTIQTNDDENTKTTSIYIEDPAIFDKEKITSAPKSTKITEPNLYLTMGSLEKSTKLQESQKEETSVNINDSTKFTQINQDLVSTEKSISPDGQNEGATSGNTDQSEKLNQHNLNPNVDSDYENNDESSQIGQHNKKSTLSTKNELEIFTAASQESLSSKMSENVINKEITEVATQTKIKEMTSTSESKENLSVTTKESATKTTYDKEAIYADSITDSIDTIKEIINVDNDIQTRPSTSIRPVRPSTSIRTPASTSTTPSAIFNDLVQNTRIVVTVSEGILEE
jgi:hypothetical protein